MTHSEQVCTIVSGLLFSFPENLLKDLVDRAGEMSVLILTFAMFMKLWLMIGCIHNIVIGFKNGRYGFEIPRKHGRLVFVFSREI